MVNQLSKHQLFSSPSPLLCNAAAAIDQVSTQTRVAVWTPLCHTALSLSQCHTDELLKITGEPAIC